MVRLLNIYFDRSDSDDVMRNVDLNTIKQEVVFFYQLFITGFCLYCLKFLYVKNVRLIFSSSVDLEIHMNESQNAVIKNYF